MSGDADAVVALREWAFETYARPGVEELCLELQDGHGLDVVTVLWCTWLGEHHGSVEPVALGRILDELGSWQREVVAPLRAVRRRLKQHGAPGRTPGAAGASPADDPIASAAAGLRHQVAAAELAAETIELDHLEVLTITALVERHVDRRPGPAAVRTNLERLLAVRDLGADTGCEDAVGRYLEHLGIAAR